MQRLAHLIIRIANAQLDKVIRISILEGIAHVKPWLWANKHDGLARAQAFFQEKGIPIPPQWFEFKDMGVYRAMLFTAIGVLKNKERAEDIVGDILSGESRSTTIEGGELYDVGRVLARQESYSLTHAIGMLKLHAKHRALAPIKKQREESLTVENEEGGVEVKDISRSFDTDSEINNLISYLSSPQGGNIWEAIRQEIGEEWASTPSKLKLVDMFIEHPDWSDVQIGRAMAPGIPDGAKGSWIQLGAATRVSRIRREFFAMIPKLMEEIPGVLSDIQLKQELSGLGYGQSHRWAKQAKNLVQILKAAFSK